MLYSSLKERSRRKKESAKQTTDHQRKPLHNSSDDDDDKVLGSAGDSESSESDDSDDDSDTLDEVIDEQMNDNTFGDNVQASKRYYIQCFKNDGVKLCRTQIFFHFKDV